MIITGERNNYIITFADHTPVVFDIRSCNEDELELLFKRTGINPKRITEPQISEAFINAMMCEQAEDLSAKMAKKSEINNDYNDDVESTLSSDLSPQQKDGVRKVIQLHQAAFAKNEFDLGSVPAEMCPLRIDICDSVLAFHKPFPVSLEKRKAFRALINDMLQAGIIEPSTARGACPAILVPKPKKRIDW